MPPVVQINDGLRPRASHEAPVKIAPGRFHTFNFTVPKSGINVRFLLLVSAQTDLLGGGRVNRPEYKLELRNPSGNAVKTKTVTGTEYIQEIPVVFDLAGAWNVRVTNLKKDFGALDVTRLSVAPQPPSAGRRTW